MFVFRQMNSMNSDSSEFLRLNFDLQLETSLLLSPQGVILVYDITNRWSFDGIDRWIKEIDEVSDQSINQSVSVSKAQHVVCSKTSQSSDSLKRFCRSKRKRGF